ncbi:MAG: fructose-6-phosphate aldolase [Bacteroidetes bacterium]|nr:fructose-6-phosphate aldolase [Bacteroidota bacterium]
MAEIYYILKVQGKAKIPDYIQVRDAHFTLIGYFRPNRGQRHSHAETPDPKQALFNQIELLAEDIPFGKITQIQI